MIYQDLMEGERIHERVFYEKETRHGRVAWGLSALAPLAYFRLAYWESPKNLPTIIDFPIGVDKDAMEICKLIGQ